ncbi:saccharopine dehydrogenase NADP-binding domain-containing protein [Paenibacillus sp. S-38]|uniref:saccharopine dehydrogenase NADP-binding domain-containing protein n=1 Tax=Paenibacillus sp. S-38 TaxID=3416710 RepID=UPI003CECBD39
MRASELHLTLLGSGGGVAKAVLSLLQAAAQTPGDPLYSLLSRSRVHLVDLQQKEPAYYRTQFPDLYPRLKLHEFDAMDTARLQQHLRATGTRLVIDVSWADTLQMLQCCDQLGIAYVNTALENTAVDEDESLEGFTLIERYRRVEAVRSSLKGLQALIGSGMNPGIVQWMALELKAQAPEEEPEACYIVERDTSFYRDPSLAKPGTLYSTWSPECFLDEAIFNHPLYMSRGIPHILLSRVYEQEFRVELGDVSFYGRLMPHEEVLTLGRRFKGEIGFLYRVNEVTTAAIRDHLDRLSELWDWEEKVLDPAEAELAGEDLVGVLLVYKDRERYMYNIMRHSEVYPSFPTNATYYQVACGVYAALAVLLRDNPPQGVHYVDELSPELLTRYGAYVRQHMPYFVTGENPRSGGLLFHRMREG